MAQGIRGVADDQVVFILAAAEKTEPVLIIDPHPHVLEADGVAREKLPADVHEHLVRLSDVDHLDLPVVSQLSGHAAVTASDDQHPLHVRVQQSNKVMKGGRFFANRPPVFLIICKRRFSDVSGCRTGSATGQIS